jgi:AmmeMemoRadiSam system protein B
MGKASLISIVVLGLGFGLWALVFGGRVNQKREVVNANGLIIPHHLVAEKLIKAGLEQYKADTREPEVLFLLVPNHGEAGGKAVVMREGIGERCGNGWGFEQDLVRYDKAILEQEHSVADIEPLVQKTFSETLIVPMVISNRIGLETIELIAALIGRCETNFGVIAAIDFSHYLTSSEAEVKDEETLAIMQARDYPALLGLGNDHVDAPAALTVFLQVMDSLKATKMDLIANTNSGVLLGDRNASVTSYVVGVFTN